MLLRQQKESFKEDIVDPSIDEAEYLFVIKSNEDVDSVIHEIIQIAKCL